MGQNKRLSNILCSKFPPFKSYADLLVNIDPKNKVAVSRRLNVYNWQWRLIMKKYISWKYQMLKGWNQLEKFFTEYEDYVIATYTGGRTGKDAEIYKFQSYLTQKLVKPWKVIKHPKRFWTIKDPNNNVWYRALDEKELLKALKLCYKESKKSNAKTKTLNPFITNTWTLNLNWNECVNSYRVKRKKSPTANKEDYDVALCICENIIKTRDRKTGNWKAWNHKWYRLAHTQLGYFVKIRTKVNVRYFDPLSLKMKTISHRKANFTDVSNFVFKHGTKGTARGAFMLGVMFAVGGKKAANIIKQYRKTWRWSK